MLYTDACIYFLIGIVTVAYPLLLTAFARLDDRYESSLILNLFRQENIYKAFNKTLGFALIASVFHIILYFILSIILGPCFSNTNGWLIPTGLIVMIASVTLTVRFVKLVNLILLYFSIENLVLHLQKQQEDDEYRIFRALADILNIGIKRSDEATVNTLSRYFYLQFATKRQKAKNQPLIYPAAFYTMIYNLVRDLAPLNNPKLKRLEYAATNGTWLLGEMQYTPLSENTYKTLWAINSALVLNGRDDLFMYYWEMAHQYMKYVLRGPSFEPVVGTQQNLLQNEQRQFLYFHVALAALLLHKRLHLCLSRAIRFTNNHPPTYELLPTNITVLLSLYRETVDDFSTDAPPIEFRFNFPGTEGEDAAEIIRNSIVKYLALLLVRFYTIPSPYYGFEYVSTPAVPSDLTSMTWYVENLPYFITVIEKILQDTTLLQETNLDKVTREYCEHKKLPYPTTLLENYVERIRKMIETREREQQISDTKVNTYRDSSVRILLPIFDTIQQLNRTSPIVGATRQVQLTGARSLMNKFAFCENQPVEHLNYDTVVGEVAAINLATGFSQTLNSWVTTRYLIKREDLKKSVQKLNVSNNYHVLLLGLSTRQLSDIKSFEGLTISEISQPAYDPAIFHHSILIISKESMPEISHPELDPDQIADLQLVNYNARYNIYGSVIDLNENEDIQKMFTAENGKDLSKSVGLYLTFRMLFTWPADASICQIDIYDEYGPQAIPNTIADIKPLS